MSNVKAALASAFLLSLAASLTLCMNKAHLEPDQAILYGEREGPRIKGEENERDCEQQ